MTSIPKQNVIRLKGKPKKRLQLAVMERDGYRCQTCGEATEGPPHHSPYLGQGGSDIPAHMFAECEDCHYEIHHGSMMKVIGRMVNFYGMKHVIRYFLMGVISEKEAR